MAAAPRRVGSAVAYDASGPLRARARSVTADRFGDLSPVATAGTRLSTSDAALMTPVPSVVVTTISAGTRGRHAHARLHDAQQIGDGFVFRTSNRRVATANQTDPLHPLPPSAGERPEPGELTCGRHARIGRYVPLHGRLTLP